MRILMTTDTIGGVWSFAIELARASRPLGIEFALATMGRPLSDGQRKQVEALGNIRVHESSFKLEWMENPWSDIAQSGRLLLDLEQQFQPHIIHLNGYAHGALPFIAPILMTAHSCVLSWWRAVKGEDAPPSWNYYREQIRKGLAGADLVTAPSAAMMRAIQLHYGTIARTRIIPNGRDASRFSSGPKENFILCAGRMWDQAKNLAALDRITPALKWPIYVAGECGDNPAANARMLGLLNEPDLARWMSQAAIFASPAKYEPFGLSILEAALSGCALVLGDIQSLHEIWADTALYASDDAELADALEELIENPTLRHDLSVAAKDRALRYSAAGMAQNYAAAYRQLSRLSIMQPSIADVPLAAAAMQ